MRLRPLADADAGELLDELLGRDPSLGDLAARLRARAAGNPFFVEELVQSLVQSGTLTGAKGAYRLARPVDDAAIPSSVQAVLAASIDRLAARDKDVLQTAAVIGKQFTEPVLRAVSGLAALDLAAALRALAAAELVFEHTAHPVAEYTFKHPLTQEVAYGTQLAARRSLLHADVARALEREVDEASAEQAALIAYHWERAGAAWEAAQWHHRAAHALVGTDTREALVRLRRVLALLGAEPQSVEAVTLALEAHDDLLRAGTLAGLPRDEGAALFATARGLAERTGNRSLLVRLLSTFSEFLMMSGQSADAHARLGEAAELADGVDDDSVQLGVSIDHAQTAFWAGRLREAEVYVDDAQRRIERGIPKGSSIPVGLTLPAFVLALRGLCRSLMGRPREGAADLDRVLRLADEDGSLEGQCIARQFRSIGALTAGDLSGAVAQAHAAGELAVRAGNSYLELMTRTWLGYAYAYAGRAEDAVPLLQPLADDDGEAPAIGMLEWFMLSALAEAHRRLGDLDSACAIAARTVELARANGALTAECNAQLVLARAGAVEGRRGAPGDRRGSGTRCRAHR
jgi:adenylate cyclase